MRDGKIIYRIWKITESKRKLCCMQENSVLYVTSDILRGGGSSWRIYRAVIEKKPVVLIARDTIAKMFKVSVTEVQKFIISCNFPIFEARLTPANKSKQKTLTLLSTAVKYWKYLYKRKQLTHLHSRTDERWKKFMVYCETLKCAEACPEQEPIQVLEYNCTPDDNFELIQSGRLFECFIESVGILSVVVDRWGKYWISPQSGLSVINAPAEWLNNELKGFWTRNYNPTKDPNDPKKPLAPEELQLHQWRQNWKNPESIVKDVRWMEDQLGYNFFSNLPQDIQERIKPKKYIYKSEDAIKNQWGSHE